MSVSIDLEPAPGQCSFVPLAVIGYCFTRAQLLQPLWAGLHLALKTYQHSPVDKLQDLLLAILAGCRSLAQVNTRVRPDLVLAQAWQRPQLAEQSTLSRTLDAFHTDNIAQLRAGNLALLAQYSQLHNHDWTRPLVLDIDPTSLLASKRAEGSRKGWVSGKKTAIAGTSSASRWLATMKVCCRWPIPAISMVTST